MLRFLTAALLLTIGSGTSRAHEGPPFEIMNEASPPFQISVWSDPDIGIGTFFVVLEPLRSQAFQVPDSVMVHVAPVGAPALEQGYGAELQRVRYGARYYAEVPFDSGGYWTVRVTLKDEDRIHELRTEVEVTPDGTIGPIGLLLYALPFVAVGILWLKAYLRRRGEGVGDVAQR